MAPPPTPDSSRQPHASGSAVSSPTIPTRPWHHPKRTPPWHLAKSQTALQPSHLTTGSTLLPPLWSEEYSPPEESGSQASLRLWNRANRAPGLQPSHPATSPPTLTPPSTFAYGLPALRPPPSATKPQATPSPWHEVDRPPAQQSWHPCSPPPRFPLRHQVSNGALGTVYDQYGRAVEMLVASPVSKDTIGQNQQALPPPNPDLAVPSIETAPHLVFDLTGIDSDDECSNVPTIGINALQIQPKAGPKQSKRVFAADGTVLDLASVQHGRIAKSNVRKERLSRSSRRLEYYPKRYGDPTEKTTSHHIRVGRDQGPASPTSDRPSPPRTLPGLAQPLPPMDGNNPQVWKTDWHGSVRV